MDILSGKSYKTYSKLSRYSSFPYYYNNEDKKYIYSTTEQLDDSTPFTAHVVEKNDTYDSLALYYYNNPTYFWVICDFNRVQDPYQAPAVGTVLKIPVFSSIRYR